MNDLTEQYQKGELPDGMYYMENTRGIISMVGHSKAFPCYNVKQILASVPTYEEWKRILHYAGKYECEYTSCVMDFENLKEENTKLKELLKDARNVLKMVDTYYGDYDSINGFLIVEKINQALGEDK